MSILSEQETESIKNIFHQFDKNKKNILQI